MMMMKSIKQLVQAAVSISIAASLAFTHLPPIPS
jgi:hypothetical protein